MQHTETVTDLDRVKAKRQSQVQGFQYPLMTPTARHALKAIRLQRVQTQVQQAQPCKGITLLRS